MDFFLADILGLHQLALIKRHDVQCIVSLHLALFEDAVSFQSPFGTNINLWIKAPVGVSSIIWHIFSFVVLIFIQQLNDTNGAMAPTLFF